MTTLKKGSKGTLVKALQYILGIGADGIFGAKTKEAVIAYQKGHGLTPDGEVGPATMGAIAKNAPTLRFGAKGAYVCALETLLQTLEDDGYYHEDEVAHIKTFQSSAGLAADGVVGLATWRMLLGVDTPKGSSGGTNTKQPVYYLQGDSKWGKILFTSCGNKSQTIASSGCGITSMAMIIATWWDKAITPKQTAAECVAKGYRTKNSGTAPGYFKFCAKKYNAKYISTTSIATAQNIVDQGGLVIVNVGPSVWTKGGHYIVWWRRDGNTVYINDPASKASKRVKNTLTTLKKAGKGYYCFLKG